MPRQVGCRDRRPHRAQTGRQRSPQVGRVSAITCLILSFFLFSPSSFLRMPCRFLSQSVMTQLVHQFVESVKLGRSALAENVLSGGTIQPDSTAAAEPTPSAAAATNKEPVEPPKPVCLSAAAASFSPSVAATAEAASSSTAEKEEAKPHSPRGQSSGWGPWARAQLAAWRAPYYMTGARNRDTSPVKPMNEFHNWVKDGIYRQHLRSVQLIRCLW